MDAPWAAWVDGCLQQLDARHLTRVLRPVVATRSATEAAIHEDQLAAWLRGAPASSDPAALPATVECAAAAAAAISGAASASGSAAEAGPLRPLRMFGLNDYLGLSTHPDVCRAVADAAMAAGMGPRSSALVCGFTTEHRLLELELARLKGTEDCLLFPTGYAANMAVLSTLASVDAGSSGSGGGSGDVVIFSDELNHASIIDGARLAVRGGGGGGASSSGGGVASSSGGGAAASSSGGGGAAASTSGGGSAAGSSSGAGAPRVRLEVYRHCDLRHLESLLSRCPPGCRKLVVTDGLFSMDGDFADLRGLARLKRRYGFLLVVDDAHATLVAGPHGGGTSELQAASDAADVTVGTLSKAAGCLGGFAACSARLRALLLNRGRHVIFSTALPLPVVAGARAALRVSQRESWRRDHLWSLVRRLSSRLSVPAHSPIIPLVIGPEAATMDAARQLLAMGFHVGAIRPPTVPSGTCRLRVSLSAAHSNDDVDALAAAVLRVTNGVTLLRLPFLEVPPPWSEEWRRGADAADAAEAAHTGGGGSGGSGAAAAQPRSRL